VTGSFLIFPPGSAIQRSNGYIDRSNNRRHFIQLCSSAAKNSDALTKLLAAQEVISIPLLSLSWRELIYFVRLAPNKIDDVWEFAESAWKLANEAERQWDEFNRLGGYDYFADRGAEAVWAINELGLDIADLPKVLESKAKAKLMETTADIHASVQAYADDPYSLLHGDILAKFPLIADVTQQAMREAGLTESADWHFTELAMDQRGPARYSEPQPTYHFFNGGQGRFPLSPSDRAFYERLNYCSVGHSNLGIVSFTTDNRIRHDLIWYPETDLEAIERGAWVATRHEIDLSKPPEQSSD
jgi:hypothetical protein